MALTQRRRPTGLMTLLAGATLVLSACTSGAQHDAPSPVPSPSPDRPVSTAPRSPVGLAEAPTGATVGICPFAQVVDVAKAFGAPQSAVSVSSLPSAIGDTRCSFALASSNLELPGTVQVTLRADATAAELKRARAAAVRAVDVPRVGDAAFYVASPSTLQLIRRTSLVIIQVGLRGPAQSQRSPHTLKTDVVSLARVLATQL